MKARYLVEQAQKSQIEKDKYLASNLNNIHMIDNLCMELIVNSISTLIWSTIFPSYELYFVCINYLSLHFGFLRLIIIIL